MEDNVVHHRHEVAESAEDSQIVKCPSYRAKDDEYHEESSDEAARSNLWNSVQDEHYSASRDKTEVHIVRQVRPIVQQSELAHLNEFEGEWPNEQQDQEEVLARAIRT